MKENPTVLAGLGAATAILVLAVGGCNGRPPAEGTQQAMGEAEAQEATAEQEDGFAEQLQAIEDRLDFQFGAVDRTPANILIRCPGDPCDRTISPLGEHHICHPGNGNCPTEVRWHVVAAPACLTQGTDSVVIRRKDGEEQCFPARTITGPPWTADSGPPDAACQPSEGQPIPWWYEVRLERQGCPDVVLDPVVIIEPYGY